MAIHAISGKPGGGKSMYSVKLILDELVWGSRVIITNVPLDLARLNEYLQKEHPNKSVDLHARVRLMDEDMTQEFWTYRPAKDGYGWVRIPRLDKKQWEEGKKPSYAMVEDMGVMYVIDECHNFFNARAWVGTGRDVLFYLSQHRHLGDTVVWITQAVMNVDKQFRSVTQDYTYLRNLTKEKMGLFRLPALFVRKTYGGPATENSQPMETGSFRLNVTGLASLYSTAAGVGIHDRGQGDMKERRKGIHWLVPVCGIPLLVLAIVKFVPSGVAAVFNPVKHGAAVAIQHTNAVPLVSSPMAPAAVAMRERPGRDLVGLPAPVSSTYARGGDSVGMVGFAVSPNAKTGEGVLRVFLSDGRKYRMGDGHLTFLCDDFCVIDGVTNWSQQVDSPPVLPVQQVASFASPIVMDTPVQQNPAPQSSVFVIPGHQNTLSHPAVRDAVSRANVSQNASVNY
jgi:hypothetical protein